MKVKFYGEGYEFEIEGAPEEINEEMKKLISSMNTVINYGCKKCKCHCPCGCYWSYWNYIPNITCGSNGYSV